MVETMKRSTTTRVVIVVAVGLLAVVGAVVAVNAFAASEIVRLMVNGGALIIAFFALEMALIYGIAAFTARSKHRGKSSPEERD